MALASLLHVRTDRTGLNVFAFEHAMAHRQLLGAMAPLPRFSVVPYFIDPQHELQSPNTLWQVNHQQAHDDAMTSLPTFFGRTTVGIRPAQIYVAENQTDPMQLRWFTFANHTEHFTMNNSIQNPFVLTFPFG